ncbi:mRNA splicing protein [Recurvomyces mirabilis]|nr:mRNA splicing protein [Recurvomyces mirabilis]
MAVAGSRISLSSALPKPRYTGEDEELPTHTQQKGPRVVDAREIESQQLVVKRAGPPPYGQRSGWRPRNPEDFGDGGAFPEVAVAQYPLDMGRKGAPSTSNALAIQVDGEGKVRYDAIARRGHGEGRIVHASFKDLIPLRQRADAGDVNLEKPSEEEVLASKERTQKALQTLVDGTLAAQKPKNVKGTSRPEPTFVRYTPANQMGDNSKKQDRIMKIVQRQQDPMEPPKHKVKKIPRGPPSPPPPVMHSPPRKLTAEDQEAWRIPPPVSNWKNPKGYTVPLDKRLAADGRGLQDVTINDKFAQFSEALQTADRHAREEVQQRHLMQQRLAEREKEEQEERLRMLAQKSRADRAAAVSGGQSSAKDARSRSRSADSRSSYSSYSDRSDSRSRSRSRSPDDEKERRERERVRAERRQEAQRELRQKNMGNERRIQMMARQQNRDISEKVALGLAKPTQSKETMYDSRLFNQSSGFAAGFNEDQAYDKPLFAERDALNSIYRPSVGNDDDEDDGGETMEKIQDTKRFESLGRAPKEGFRGTETTEARSGPVQFERDRGGKPGGDDPFGVDAMIADVVKNTKSGKRGADDVEEGGGKGKRARVDDDETLQASWFTDDAPYDCTLAYGPAIGEHLHTREAASTLSYIATPPHKPGMDQKPDGSPRELDRAQQQAPPRPLPNDRGIWGAATHDSSRDGYGAFKPKNLNMITVATPIAPETSAAVATTFPPTSTVVLLPHDSAKLHRDASPIPNWAIGLLGGLLSFGVVLAVLLYLINFPPRLAWLRNRGWLRSHHRYTRVFPHDDIEMSDSIATATTSAAEKQGKPRKRNKLSIDTSTTYQCLGIAVPGKNASPAVDVTHERRQSYDEEKRAPRSQRPMSPTRFAWEAVTAPIPSIRAFTPLVHLRHPKSSRLAKEYDTSYGAPEELESGSYTPSTMSTYGTPLAPAVTSPVQLLKDGNVFERLGERIEHAADRLGRILSAQVEGDPEEGLLLPVQVHERENVGMRGSAFRGVC